MRGLLGRLETARLNGVSDIDLIVMTMKQPVSVKTQFLIERDKIDDLQQSLDLIEHKMDAEIAAKQNTIERQEEEVRRLQSLIQEKNQLIRDIEEKLLESMRKGEGNRQLINKLLNDIERLNHDVEWYKRTFEKRSLAGLIKDRLKYFFSK